MIAVDCSLYHIIASSTFSNTVERCKPSKQYLWIFLWIYPQVLDVLPGDAGSSIDSACIMQLFVCHILLMLHRPHVGPGLLSLLYNCPFFTGVKRLLHHESCSVRNFIPHLPCTPSSYNHDGQSHDGPMVPWWSIPDIMLGIQVIANYFMNFHQARCGTEHMFKTYLLQLACHRGESKYPF